MRTINGQWSSIRYWVLTIQEQETSGRKPIRYSQKITAMERVMQMTINGKVVHPIYKKRKRKPKNTDLTPLGMLKRELKFMEMRAKYNNREGGKYGKKYAQEMVIEYKKAIETLTQNSSRHDREE